MARPSITPSLFHRRHVVAWVIVQLFCLSFSTFVKLNGRRLFKPCTISNAPFCSLPSPPPPPLPLLLFPPCPLPDRWSQRPFCRRPFGDKGRARFVNCKRSFKALMTVSFWKRVARITRRGELGGMKRKRRIRRMFIWTKKRRRSWRGREMGRIMRENKGGFAERRISREGGEGLIYDGMLS